MTDWVVTRKVHMDVPSVTRMRSSVGRAEVRNMNIEACDNTMR